MASSSHLLLLPPLIFLLAASFLLPLAISDNLIEETFLGECDIIEYQKSQVTKEFNSILSVLQKMTPANSFFQTSLTPYNIYGLSWCRNTISDIKCAECLSYIVQKIKKDCLHKNIAGARYMSYYNCYLRFNLIDFRGKSDTSVGLFWHEKSLMDSTQIKNYTDFLTALKKKYPDFLRSKFTEVNNDIGDSSERPEKLFQHVNERNGELQVKVFGTVQCSEDLSQAECKVCVDQSIKDLNEFCGANVTCAIIYGSCFLEYRTLKLED